MEEPITLDNASALLCPVKGVSLPVLQIKNLFVEPEHRNKGQASALITSIASKADDAHYALIVNPDPAEEEVTIENLVKLYERHGFKHLQDKPVLLYVRMPNVKLDS